jgi:hypothetical protein
MPMYKTDRELAEMLRAKLAKQTQRAWADNAGISPAYLSDFLAGRRGPGPALLRALGFESTAYYRKAEK